MLYIIIFALSFILTYLIKEYAIKKSLLAEVNDRSSHTIPTPHGGGIAIAVTWFLGLFYLYFSSKIDESLFFALLGGAILSIIGFLDDLYDLSPKIRVFTQAFVAVWGLYFLGGLKELDFFIFSVDNSFLTNIFAFFLIVWFINLYNFLDGINGYAGSEAVFLALSGYILFGDSFFLVLLVSVLGFLLWNFGNAKIFMGDVGSTLLGYNVAIFTIYYANYNSKNFWIWIILFSLFWFDATYTIIKRFLNREKLSQAHRKHAYQRLTQAGFSHIEVATYSIFINILVLASLYFIKNIALCLVFDLVLMIVLIKYVNSKKEFDAKR